MRQLLVVLEVMVLLAAPFAPTVFALETEEETQEASCEVTAVASVLQIAGG